MPSFTVSFAAYDRANKRNLYFKVDGGRFADARTLKICSDVKYDVTVTVKPSVAQLLKLVIGGDDITPDSKEEKPESCEYSFTWFTNGYPPTDTGKRRELRFSFLFDNAEFATNFQVKFYPVTKASHLTWGTEIRRIELEGRGEFGGAGATGFQNLSPSNIKFT